MNEKIMDFGVFGKWSPATLMAQSNADYFGLPAPVIAIHSELENRLSELRKTKIKKMTVGDFIRTTEEISSIEENLKQYTEIRKVVDKENAKEREKSKKARQGKHE